MAPDFLFIVLAALVVGLIAWCVGKLSAKKTSQQVSQTSRANAPTHTLQDGLEGNIFISYSSADRPIAKDLAAALSEEGWLVWWDREIPPGKSFDEVIEAALTAAKCVIVLWSKSSVASDWVKVEAADAAKRHILIPALIENVEMPLEFRRIQAADLIGWRGSKQHAGFEILLESIANIIPKSAVPS